MLHSRNPLLRKKKDRLFREPSPKRPGTGNVGAVLRKKSIYISGLACARKSRIWAVDRRSRSNDERAIEVHGTEATMLLDPHLNRLGNAVEAQIILRYVDFGE